MFLSKSVTCLLLLTLTSCLAQENVPPNAQPRVAPHLQECYRQRAIFERDNRLPMTAHMLIELIRKAEDSPNFTLNLQQFTTSLLHRFKQDGILPSSTGVAINQNDILPFNTNGFNFPKHRVLLTRLIPGNHALFPNASLTLQEQCALHFMLSTSIETQVRGDENQRCGRLAQYRSVRIPRNTDEVELMKNSEMANVRRQLHKRFGRYQQEDEEPAEEVAEEQAYDDDEEEAADENEEEILEIGGQTDGLVDVASNAVSQCPVENGVINSPWGSFSGGTVIAGIAAGLERQQVSIRDLVDESHFGQYRMARQQAVGVDNRFAATLSGDISEAVLLQAPNPIQVGASGAWNNTAVPNWYFLTQREALQQTDAEIRGGIDGILIGHHIQEWRNRASNLRLSQILDMYYSQRGIFGMINAETSFRACNRRHVLTSIQQITNALAQQSFAFATVLDSEMQSQVTLTPNSTQRFTEQASNTLMSYISRLNDMECFGTETVPNDPTIWRAATDIYIFVDTTWTFREIHSMIAHLLNNLDVNRFGSTYTIMNAMDGTIIVNSTNQLADLYIQWTAQVHATHPIGFNIRRVLETMRTHSVNLMDFERDTAQVGGRSHIALVIPNTATVNEADTNAAVQDLVLFRDQFPDLRFIYWAAGNPDRFSRFVREPARDTFELRIDLEGIGGESIIRRASDVIWRIQQEPRRIINHRCGSNWQPEGQTGMSQMQQFVEPRGIAFYRLHPNYFFHNGGDRRVRIQGAGFSSITVCTSRTIERPRANATNSQGDDVRCQNVNSDTMEFGLWDACAGHSLIHHCPPLFISVEGARVHDGQNLQCTERNCRFPDDARFNVIVDNLGCFSGVGTIAASVLLLLISLIVTIRT